MEISFALPYLVIAFVSLALYYYKRNETYWARRGIPHEKPSFLYGTLRGCKTTRPLRDIYRDYYFKFKGSGPFVGIHFFFKPAVMLFDLDLIRNILIKDYSISPDRGLFHNEIDDPLSANLFSLNAEKWKQLRHKLTPSFTPGKMKLMFPIITSIADQLIMTFDASLKKSSIVEVKDLVARFTTDAFVTCAFGIECNSLKDPDLEFRVTGAKTAYLKRHGKIIEFFMLSYPKLSQQLRLRELPDEFHEFFTRMVRENVALRQKNAVKRNDFMDLLIGTMQSEQSLKIEKIAAQCFFFFVAGFDSPATTMGFALYELAFNQNLQNKLRAEVNEQFDKNGGSLTFESMADMHYMEKIFKETLRKYSVAVQLVRHLREEYQTSDPKFVIPKGTPVFIPIDSIHHDPEIYPDPEKFDPERFNPEEIQKRHPSSWLPFGDGPRNRIGQRFGRMQVYIGLAYLIRNFKFYFCDKTPNPLEYDIIGPTAIVKGAIDLRTERIHE